MKTWLGKDKDSYMRAWTNSELQTARRSKSNFQDMESSWQEQRLWGIDTALDALGSHPLAAEIKTELAPPTVPSTAGMNLTKQRTFSLPGFSVPLDLAEDGALVLGGAQLARFSYRSYSAVDVSNYVAQYRENKNGSSVPDCGDKDFCKPGMPGMPGAVHDRNSATSAVWTPTLASVHVAASGGTTLFMLNLTMTPAAYEDYGAPQTVMVSVNASGSQMDIVVTALQKTATRLPEAAFVTFNPNATGSWSHQTLGLSSNATALVSHGSAHLHGAEAVDWHGAAGGSLRVASLDAGLLCYGEPTAFPTSAGTSVQEPFGLPDLSQGASWNLWNNLWGTNYPQWYPFDPADTNLEFRFSLEFSI